MGNLLMFSVVLLYGAIFSSINGDLVEDKQALLDFLHNVHHPSSLNWNNSKSVCTDWIGVTCNNDHSRVIALRLPAVGLKGSFPTNTISRLSAIQILSLRSNGISGSFPSDLVGLKKLTTLYLQFNRFAGPLPTDFSVWKNLSTIDLSNNGFNGSIPFSFSNLTHLTALNLANNSFSGEIPDLSIPTLQQLNLANNNLTGTLPKSLQRFPKSAFIGNKLSSESNTISPALPIQPPKTQPSRKNKKLGDPALLGIISGCVLLFVFMTLLMILCNSTKKGGGRDSEKSCKEVALSKKVSQRRDKSSRVVFFEECNLVFDLEDLLRASAEVLGKGMYGTTYKATLEDATSVVVKRLKEGTVAKRDFEQQMEIVGNIKHENIVALRAYYYSKEEKLMIYDYFGHGSVSALLHGQRDEGGTPLDWETRLKIAIGAARGIAHIHTQNGGKFAHGNIKASNIFLNPQRYGCVCDTGLATLMSPAHPPVTRATGYRAPEITDTRKVTNVSDVYSFGVLLLELLTGKSPTYVTGSEEVVHLVRWVNSVVREEWTAEVFDVALLKYPNIEEEMVEMLQIGMACVVKMPEQRPKMTDVVKMVEGIRRNRSSTETKSEVSSSSPTPYADDTGSSSAQK